MYVGQGWFLVTKTARRSLLWLGLPEKVGVEIRCLDRQTLPTGEVEQSSLFGICLPEVSGDVPGFGVTRHNGWGVKM